MLVLLDFLLLIHRHCEEDHLRTKTYFICIINGLLMLWLELL